MKKLKILILVFATLSGSRLMAQAQYSSFERIYNLVEQKNFFRAKDVYALQKKDLSIVQQKVIEAFLDNAYNRPEASNEKIMLLIQAKNKLPDSLMLKLYKTKEDNAVKLFDYREAKNTLTKIIAAYKQLLTEDDKKDMENNLKIWTALEHEAKQQVEIKEGVSLKMEKDKAGLNNLKVSDGKDSIDFIFDTGANLSTTSETTAKQLDMKIIPVDIETGTITGDVVPAQLAVCPILRLGTIEIRNSVFIVLKDEALTFSQIGYQIHGILGFPVIEALKEIQITRSGYFIVSKEETKSEAISNMAMDGLTPLVVLNDKPFALDTGADSTLLYAPYFFENRQDIESNYMETTISFGGAAGVKECRGYRIDVNFDFNDKNVSLKNVRLLKSNLEEKEKTIYGNIGQDLIKQFEKMTLNFNQMFIKLD